MAKLLWNFMVGLSENDQQRLLRKNAGSDSEQVIASSAIAKKEEKIRPRVSEWLIFLPGMCETECKVIPDNDGDNLQDGLV